MSNKKACEILMALARSEKQLEILRQTLCELPDFEPYATFRHLDTQRKNYLQTPDFLAFFEKNRLNLDENLIEEILIRHYDFDHDGKLCYAEYILSSFLNSYIFTPRFLRIILPNDEPGLRTLVTQRPTYVGELPEEVLEQLLKLLQSEISSFTDLEPVKRELFAEGSSVTVSSLFHEIDKDSTGFLNFANLFEFFKKNSIYPYEEEIIAIIRKLDKDDDGRLVLEELEEGLGELQKGPANPGFNKCDYSKPVYKNDTFNPNTYGPVQTTSIKKNYKYEPKYIPKFNYDEQLTEKGPSNSKYEPSGESGSNNKPQEKLSRNYNNYKEPAGCQPRDYQPRDYQPREYQPRDYQPRDYQPRDNQPRDHQASPFSYKEPTQNPYAPKENPQKSGIITSTYVRRPSNNDQQREPEEAKEYVPKYISRGEPPKAPAKTERSLMKSTDYAINPNTKSPPRSIYYPYEPMRKIFSPMKDKILKSSRFDAPEDPYERKTKSQLYQATSNNRTRTPNQPRADPGRIDDKLKKIDDTYAKNSRYHGLNRESKAPEDLIQRSAPRQVLYRDYTPEPGAKKNMYKTVDLTPDKLYNTSYMQSSQYRRDKEIVDKIMGSSEKPASQSYNPRSSGKQDYANNSSTKLKTPVKSSNNRDQNTELKDLAVFFSSLMNFEAELERMKQDLALRPDFNLVDLFVFFDKEQKGFCTLEDFQETLRVLELYVQEKEATLFIKRFDRAGSGMMKFADFTQAFTPILSDYVELLNQRKPINTDLQFSYKELFSQETLRLINNIFRAHFTNEIAIEGLRKALARKEMLDLRRVFEILDLDRDGYLVEGEIEEFMLSQGKEVSWNRSDLRLLIERVDNDRDGKISYEEFSFELNSKLEDHE